MAQIEKPTTHAGEVETVSQLLDEITKWHGKISVSAADANRSVWYRGHSDCSYILWPGVYRNDFTHACRTFYGPDLEARRLNLERHMLMEFRISGATLLDPNKIVQLYFIAQHYGMPTRLLDWTTNPLAALFFAVKSGDDSMDGDLFIMDAQRLLPGPSVPEAPRGILTMRDWYAVDAIGVSFWHEPKVKDRPALILPLRPDNQAGRFGQQSSCFTLHMHGALPCTHATLSRLKVPGKAKTKLLDELRKLNINEFSIYNDLDHLSREIKRTRGIQ